MREINAVKDRLKTSLSYSLSATKTLAFLIKRYGVPADFDSVANTILQSNKYIDALELTQGGVITHVYPLEGNESALGLNVLSDSITDKEAYRAIKKNELFFAGPLPLRQGGIGVVGRLPIIMDNTFWGFSVVLIRLPTLLKAAGIDTLRGDFIYQLSKINPRTHQEEFFLPHTLQDTRQVSSIEVPDGEWKLYVMLRDDTSAVYNGITLSLLGLILSVTGGILAWQLAIQPSTLNRLVKKKTLQLVASEKYFRSLIEKSSDAIVLLDPTGKVLYQSPSTQLISGYSLPEIQMLDGFDLIHPDDREGDHAMFHQLVQTPGAILKRNHRFLKKSGQYIWLEGTYSNLLDDENVRAIVYNYHDITQRLASEEKATLANRLYQVISRINQMMRHVKDEQMLFREACHIAVDMGKFSMAWVGMIDEANGKIIPVMHAGEDPGYREKMDAFTLDNDEIRSRLAGTIHSGTYTLFNDLEANPTLMPWAPDALASGYRSVIVLPVKKFEKVIGLYTLYASVPNYFNEKEITLLSEMTRDISFTLENLENERLRRSAEEEVMKVYKEKETTLNRINDSVVAVDRQWRYTFLNDAALATHPLGREQTLGKVIWNVHPAMKGTIFWDKYHEAMETGKVITLESYYIPMNICFFVKIYPSADGLTIFYNDITERKKAEEQIAAEKILSESVINSLPGIFYLYDRTGKFIRWNKNFETIAGYSAEEISTMHPLDFFDTDEKNLIREKIDNVFASGNTDVTAHLYTRARKKIPYYLNGRKANFAGVDYLIGMGIDITDRIEAENGLRERAEEIQKLTAHLQSIREEERTHMAREIHDVLGQQLTGLKMDAAWVARKMETGNKDVSARITGMIALIDDTVKTVRRLSSELRPGILDDLGLIPALEWQGQEFEKRTGIRLHFHTDLIDFYPERNLATNVFRVYQEALTNVARHAHASKIETTLEEKESAIILTIQDNGAGFDMEEAKTKNSLGLIGMRERARLFNGELSIKSEKQKGTVITLKVPLAATDK